MTPFTTVTEIREMADRLAVPLSTLHYWERHGLVQPQRHGGRRYYTPEQAHQLTLIRLWQATGLMSLDEIAAVLASRSNSGAWREVVTGRIAAINAQLDQLRTARAHLGHLLSCPRDDPAAECPKLRADTSRVAFNPGGTGVIKGMSEQPGAHPQADPSSHHDWHSASYVQDWISGDATRDEERRPRLRWAAGMLPLTDAPARVLDVGGGYGEFTAAVLTAFPQATVCLQDYSSPMLEHARSRLAGFGQRVGFVQADLTDPDWVETVDGPFDAVVSALAIHNLGGADAIQPVYAAIQKLVRPGGWFLNLDLVLDPYPAPDAESLLARLYTRATPSDVTTGSATGHDDHDHQGPGRRQPTAMAGSSLEDHLGWLRQAGFAPVDCPYKQLNEVLLAAHRPLG